MSALPFQDLTMVWPFDVWHDARAHHGPAPCITEAWLVTLVAGHPGLDISYQAARKYPVFDSRHRCR